MKVLYKVSEKCTVEAEGASHKELFKQLSGLAEVFSVDKCGCCNCTNISPQMRTVDDVNYFELVCKNVKCRARMSYGQSKKSEALYPRRTYHKQHPDVKAGKAKVDTYLPNNGWAKWQGNKNDNVTEED